MGVSEFLSKAAENDSVSSKFFNENQTSMVKVENAQEGHVGNNDHDTLGSLDDREEGEIVDDYEFIISSDEEFSMRQRIEELEATNAELEKIAKISGNSDEYNYATKDSHQYTTERFPMVSIDMINAMDCQRAAQVPTDASSISSVEFPTPKKRKRRKSKASRGSAHEHKQHTLKQTQKHRTETHRSDHKKHKHISRRTNMVSLRSEKDLEAHSNSYESSDLDVDDNYSSGCYLSREELRFAVARFSKSEMNSGNLKARLEKDKNRNCANEVTGIYNSYTKPKRDHSIQPIVVDDDSSDSVSLEEQELRLIALKSAVMKKHLARKKRDAEVAYSPTDFEDVLASTTFAARDDEMDVVEVEMNELEHYSRNSMEISPVASPKLHLSPEEEENSRMSMATEINEASEVENTKLVDMDIANSDSEDELPPYDNDKEKWLPLDQIPLPTIRESRTVLCQNTIQPGYDGPLYPPSCAQIPYTSFLPEYPLEPPPLPPGVAFLEEQPPPPPPFHLEYPPKKLKDFNEGDKKHDQNACLRNSRQIYAHNKVKLEQPRSSVQSSNEHVKIERESVDDDDEEEEALRALLLSKFNTQKVWKPKNASNQSKEDSSKQVDDSEELRSLLLTSIDKKKSCQNPTESILKEAVRRLKLKTTVLHSRCLEEEENSRSSIDRNSRNCSPFEMQKNAKQSNDVPERRGSCENVKAFIQNKDTNGNLHLAFKELQSKSKPERPIGQSSDPKTKIQKTFVTVRSVQTINEIFNLENEEVNTEMSHENKNDKQASEGSVFASSLGTVEVFRSDKGEVLHSKVELQNDNQIITCETNSNKSNEVLLNANEDMSTTKILKKADPSDNNLIKVSPEPCGIGNMRNTLEPGDKPAKDSSKSVSHELPNTKSCEEPIGKAKTPTEQNLLAGLDEPISSSTVSQSVLSKKIIKPNKIINTQSEIKRKSQDIVTVPEKTLKIASKPDSPQTISSSYSSLNNSRLITSADISTVKVKKLIISLRASDTETSDEESCLFTKNSTMNPNESRFDTMEALVCTINNEYYDNASPISLPMDSPGITPKRANSPSGEFVATDLGLTKSFVNDCFKEKLDTFLKNVRTQVQQSVSKSIKSIENVTPKSNSANSKMFTTPVAMKHLPQASQQEYRRLVHRMQLLEKQKQLKCSENATIVTKTTAKECVDSKAHTNNQVTPRILSPTTTQGTKLTSTSQESQKASNNNTLFKKVLLKNANYTPTTTTPKNNSQKSAKKNIAHQQTSKSNVLRAYENSFLKTGTGIMTNLDKSLKLVEEAKQAKMAKLQHEKRLEELRIEMDEMQHKLRQAQQQISRIYPEICESNEVITSLKQRRSKLLKAATNLGKFIKGDEYRLNNDIKQQIMMKSKILATQIKLVNSMKYSDIDKLKELLDQGVSSENPNANDNLHSEKEQDSEYAKKPNENVPPPIEIALDNSEQKETHPIDSSKLVQNTSISGPNEELHKTTDTGMGKCNYAVEPSPIEEVEETQVRALRELPEKNDVTSKEVVEFVKSISKKDDSLTTIKEHKMSLVPEYISPLLPLKATKRQLDPNGIICPYDLMGKCEDKDCNYVHISG